MSTTIHRVPLTKADRLADRLIAHFMPGCQRIQVAGSVRRRKPDVGDIEIVAIPDRDTDLFGDPAESRLDPILQQLAREGTLVRLKGGPYFQQFEIVGAGCKLDLFTPGPETWGVVFTQRTGSAEFAHQLVTSNQMYTSTGRPGLMPPEFRVWRARVWRGPECVPTPEEADVFRVFRVPWVRPEDRH